MEKWAGLGRLHRRCHRLAPARYIQAVLAMTHSYSVPQHVTPLWHGTWLGCGWPGGHIRYIPIKHEQDVHQVLTQPPLGHMSTLFTHDCLGHATTMGG